MALFFLNLFFIDARMEKFPLNFRYKFRCKRDVLSKMFLIIETEEVEKKEEEITR